MDDKIVSIACMSRFPRKWPVPSHMNWVLSAFTDCGLTTSRTWSRWRRARHGQPDQPHLRPCRTHGTAYHPRTGGHRTRAIWPASGCRRWRGRRGEVQAPILEPLQNAQQHTARRTHSSELFVLYRSECIGIKRDLLPRRRQTLGLECVV